jgi:hypothetical protein
LVLNYESKSIGWGIAEKLIDAEGEIWAVEGDKFWV